METAGEQARPTGGGSGARPEQHDEDAVRRRAYELYQARGGHGGSDIDDWFNAERELRERRGRPDDVREPGRADGTAEARADGGRVSPPAARASAAPSPEPPAAQPPASEAPAAEAPRAKGRASGAPRTTRSKRKGD